MTQHGQEKLTPRVHQHVVTPKVDCHPHHRIFGIYLRLGQNLDPAFPNTRLIAASHGLNLQDW